MLINEYMHRLMSLIFLQEYKMNELIQILKGIKPNVDFSSGEDLIEEGLLNSFDIVAIVTALNDNYKINISLAELEPEMFENTESIYKLLCSKLEK